MRKRIALCALLAALTATAARADEPDEIAGCADYRTNKTGSDAACDAAIAAEKDAQTRSVLLFRRAYMEDAAGDFKTYPKALADLDAAIKSWPQNPSALHERGYLENEYGRWKEAEADLDAQIAIVPTDSQGYQERAMSRFGAGELAGVLEDESVVIMLGPPNSGSYFARAQGNVWLGNFDDARKDVESALKISPGDKKAAEEADAIKAWIAQWTGRSSNPSAEDACRDADKAGDYKRAALIGDCTRAFLDAKTPSDKADRLTVRAMAWLNNGAEKEAAEDSEIAAALAPTATNLSNLGFAYMRRRHSTGAIWVFDRSIALRGDFWNYAGRAAAKVNIGDFQGALDDAGKSIVIRPTDLALIAEGDALYGQTNSTDKARTYWLQAWRMGDRDDDLAARLKNAGVTPPPDAPKTP